MTSLYFDYNATTPLSVKAQLAIKDAMSIFANPSSHYSLSDMAKKLLIDARRSMASLMGTVPEQILFTSGGTESNNQALSSLLATLPGSDLSAHHVISSSIEHPSVLAPLLWYQQRGLQLTLINPDNQGRISVQSIRENLRPQTRLITLMAINNETGVIQPYEAVASLAKEAGVYLHIDAVQAIGKLPFSCDTLSGVTTVSFSGHKFNGPKGIGGLYHAPGIQLNPLLHGGGQEQGVRSGTENTLGLAGLTAAAKESLNGLQERFNTYKTLRETLLSLLEQHRVNYLINGNTNPAFQAPWTLNLSFPGIRAESLASRLDLRHGISLSLGSACSNNKSTQRSHVLVAMGLPDDRIDSAVRISFGYTTSQDDIEILANAIKQETYNLLKISGQSLITQE
ncbi:aminotransferase class V-fold PLP-dependent enzyme [Photorhabdus luminescens]|uniref:Aminotransferase class V-fold PLP-dependent enzyme n=1 Tax=Photorhabdus akhurstii TaxID=171438 RepID=A0ABX8M2E2_9GAMM|nr:cysteine desulfurase family protein [Photorhabdus akhurstii]MBS9429893.1 cysteine desulfurase [Photorhabdus akhurstii]QXF35854.1 aminotransferase class V-fold PLP-dependent enzyme [Photorhabdus akhurstii]UJD77687.1 aminotransferase class V-fold PLP-dependent enzyme [Photorhabdus luminescens]